MGRPTVIKCKCGADKRRLASGKLDGYCRECKNAWQRKNRGKNPKKNYNWTRRWTYVTKYGMSAEEAEAWVKSDKVGSCEACGKTDILVIDHDHKTGTYRGKLCSSCNLILGHAGDSDVVLLNCAAYLKRGRPQ